MNEMIKKQLNHRSIRQFKDKDIPDEVFDTLIKVAQRTATSVGMQQSSIIKVTDSNLKKEIARVCNQQYVADAPVLLIFIADLYRNYQIALEQGHDMKSAGDMDKFFAAYTDAILAAQNVVNAAESMDLGTVFLGSILNDPRQICQLLELPKYTFPAIGLAIGYPDQEPQLKPRMDMSLRLFENKYKKFDNYLEEIKDHDREMEAYYDLRSPDKPLKKFSLQVLDRLIEAPQEKRQVIKCIEEQGFNIE